MPVDSSIVDAYPGLVAVVFTGTSISTLTGTLVGGFIDGIVGIDIDAVVEVFMRVSVVMVMALDDGASVSHAGDVQASLWSGSVFDSDMSVAERDRLMVDLVFFVLDCAVIGFVLNIDMSTDVNAKT